MNMVRIFAIMNSFRERNVHGHLKCKASVKLYGPGLCPVIKFMDLFFMPFVQSMFVQCIDPLGYDSDLQRICIIKLVEKTSCHSFKCEVSNINGNGFTLVLIYVMTLFIF